MCNLSRNEYKSKYKKDVMYTYIPDKNEWIDLEEYVRRIVRDEMQK